MPPLQAFRSDPMRATASFCRRQVAGSNSGGGLSLRSHFVG